MSRRQLGAAAVGLALLSALLYAPARHFDFLEYDDPVYVTANPVVREGLNADGVLWAFATTTGANWHPLTWLSHLADVGLFGLDPGAHHSVNLLVHTANVVLHLVLLHALTGALWPGVLVAALFAVHPLHVESVAWIAERKDLLSTLFALLAALAYVRAARRGRAGRSFAAPLFFVLALLAKPMPVTLPFLLLLFDWWPLGRWAPGRDGPPRADTRILGFLPPTQLWVEKIPFFVLAAASSAVTYSVQSAAGAVRPGAVVPLAIRLANAAVSYVAYLSQAFVPRGFSVFYPYRFEMPPLAPLALSVLSLVLLVILALRRRRHPWLAVGVLWYLGALVPVIGLVQVGIAARADRYTYLPLTGIFVALVWGGRDLAWRHPRLRRSLAAGAALLVLGLAAAAASYIRYWRDDETLFRHALAVTERNDVAHSQLGVAAMKRNDWGGAERHLRAALALAPGAAVVHANLGVVLAVTGRTEEAIFALRTALALNPTNATASYNLGKALGEAGRIEESTAVFRETLRLKPDSSAAANNIGQNLALQGRIDEAREWFIRAVTLDPGNLAARENLDRALRSAGHPEEAPPVTVERAGPGLDEGAGGGRHPADPPAGSVPPHGTDARRPGPLGRYPGQ